MRPAAVPKAETINDFMRLAADAPRGRAGNVVIVSDSVPERNGVGAYYRDLVDQLSTRCDKVGFLCPDGETGFVKMPLPGDPTQKIWFPSWRRYRAVMRDVRPDCIVAATPGPYGLLGLFWARRLGVPFIVGFHTHYSGVTDEYGNWLLRKLSRFYFNCADWAMFRYGDLVLGNSEAMVQLALKLGARRAEVMGTLLPTPSLERPTSPPGDEVRRVLFAGRLAPEKRVHTIVDAARELPQIEFRIAGDGPLGGEIAAAAAELDNLDWLGWVSREQLLDAMDAADLLVLPSIVESFGTVALEAMARERLVLVTPRCGIVEWPDLAEALCIIDEAETVTGAIERVAARPSADRHRMAARAREAALALNESSVNHWLGLIHDIAERASR